MIPTISVTNGQPRLTLVGAGPGDPELLTLKAVEVLKNADVVLFDALVSKAILDYVPREIPTLSVGKRAGSQSNTQDEINELIVEMAYRFGHVVRLKGGDPFVFGRGAEEIEFAERHGIETSVVPGITSAVAVPAALNIPVTARGVSESFWVITGTTRAEKLSQDIALAAQSTATVVILMGIGKMEEIMKVFQANGKSTTPVAVIQNGTMPNQKNVIGTVANISSLMMNEDISSPGIIIIGEVVQYAREVQKIVDANTFKNYE
jgi:uroporphyrin-III C-methyltransferase